MGWAHTLLHITIILFIILVIIIIIQIVVWVVISVEVKKGCSSGKNTCFTNQENVCIDIPDPCEECIVNNISCVPSETQEKQNFNVDNGQVCTEKGIYLCCAKDHTKGDIQEKNIENDEQKEKEIDESCNELESSPRKLEFECITYSNLNNKSETEKNREILKNKPPRIVNNISENKEEVCIDSENSTPPEQQCVTLNVAKKEPEICPEKGIPRTNTRIENCKQSERRKYTININMKGPEQQTGVLKEKKCRLKSTLKMKEPDTRMYNIGVQVGVPKASQSSLCNSLKNKKNSCQQTSAVEIQNNRLFSTEFKMGQTKSQKKMISETTSCELLKDFSEKKICDNKQINKDKFAPTRNYKLGLRMATSKCQINKETKECQAKLEMPKKEMCSENTSCEDLEAPPPSPKKCTEDTSEQRLPCICFPKRLLKHKSKIQFCGCSPKCSKSKSSSTCSNSSNSHHKRSKRQKIVCKKSSSICPLSSSSQHKRSKKTKNACKKPSSICSLSSSSHHKRSRKQKKLGRKRKKCYFPVLLFPSQCCPHMRSNPCHCCPMKK